MTQKIFGYETPTPSGTTITQTNTTPNLVQAPFPSTCAVTDSASAVYGSLGLKITAPGGGSAANVRHAFTAANLQFSTTVAFGLDATPTAGPSTLIVPRGSGPALRINWTTGNVLQLGDAGTAPGANLQTIYASMVPGGAGAAPKYLLTAVGLVATATTGVVTVKLYDLSTQTLLGSASYTGNNLGTTAIGQIDLGFANTNNVSGQIVRFDYLMTDDGSVTEQFPPGWGTTAISPSGIASAESFGTATVTLTQVVTPTGIISPSDLIPYDVLVDWGQSNIRGTDNDFDYPTTDFYRANVYYWDPVAHAIVAASEPAPVFEATPYMGPMNRFSRSYVDGGFLAAGRRLLIVNLAWGGTGVSLPDSNSGNKTWWPNETATHTALDTTGFAELDLAMAAIPKGSVVKAVLANHGVTDGLNSLAKATFKSRIIDVINEVQGYMLTKGYSASSTCRYINMQMRPDLLSQTKFKDMDDALQELAGSMTGVSWVASPVGSTYYKTADTVHFNAAGDRIIGASLLGSYASGVVDNSGQPSITLGPIGVSPSGIVSGETVGSATVQPGPVTVSPGGIVSAQAFGSVTVTIGPVTISPGGVASAETFGAVTVNVGPITVSPGGIATGEAFGNAKLTSFVVPSGVASAEVFGSHTVSVGPVTVSPGGVATSEAFGAAIVGTGQLIVQPVGITSGEVVPAGAVISTGAVLVTVTGIVTAQAFGVATVTITGPQTVTVVGVVSGEAFGSTVVINGSQTPPPDTRTLAFGAENRTVYVGG